MAKWHINKISGSPRKSKGRGQMCDFPILTGGVYVVCDVVGNVLMTDTRHDPPPRFVEITDLAPPLLGFSG